ncbi:MAG: ABC transporter permease [Chthonomonadales bacterium]
MKRVNSGEPAPPGNGQASGEACIADLSYRSYDGPYRTRLLRWWVIAGAWMRAVRKQPAFWALAAFSLWPYARAIFFLYLDGNRLLRRPPGAPDVGLMLGIADHTRGQQFAFQLYGALTSQWFLWMIPVALVAGAGCIAMDNRAGALMLYLARPITRAEYLAGKWAGVFVLLAGTTLVPQLFLYAYCALSYSSEGFFHNEPLLLVRAAAASLVPALVHAALLVGFSAWCRTPRIAGAAYAGFYFIVSIASQMVWRQVYHGHLGKGELVRHLHVHGAVEGVVQNIFGVTIHTITGSRRLGIEYVTLPPPSLSVMGGLCALIVVISVAAALTKIQAVEVVRG